MVKQIQNSFMKTHNYNKALNIPYPYVMPLTQQQQLKTSERQELKTMCAKSCPWRFHMAQGTVYHAEKLKNKFLRVSAKKLK